MALQQEESPGQVTSVRLPVDPRDRLDEVACITGHPRNDLVVEALSYFVEIRRSAVANG